MKKELNKKSKKKGFTLMELIVVMGIISVLVFITAPTFMSKVDQAKVSADKSNAKSIAVAVKTEMLEGKWKAKNQLTSDEKINIANLYFDGVFPQPQSKSGYFEIFVDGNKVSVKVGETIFYPK